MDLKRLYQESELGWALLGWYDFSGTERVLIAGQYSAACVMQLQQLFQQIEFYGDGTDYPRESFDAILVFGEMRSRKECISFLARVVCGGWLHARGVLLWAVDNRLGLRFLCGDVHLDSVGECFTRQEWLDIFQATGLEAPRFYYVLPGWHFPRNIYTEEHLPGERSLSRMECRYVRPEVLIRDETGLIRDSICNGIFPSMANAFLLEWRRAPGEGRRAVYVDMTADKGLQASALVCYTDATVSKKPLFPAGSVRDIYEHGEQLRHRGIGMVEQQYDGREIWMPYVDVPLLADVLAERAAESPPAFFDLLEQWWQDILRSSEPAGGCDFPVDSGVDYGLVLATAYLDLVPTNCFFQQDEFLYFDQEYVRANYPAKFVLYRGLILLYGIHPEIGQHISLQQVREHYGLTALWPVFEHVEQDIFQQEARGYAAFRSESQAMPRLLRRNLRLLKQMDRLAEQDIFGGLGDKALILFGAGHYCEAYLQEYGGRHRPHYIVDNDPAKWGQVKDGVVIRSPQILAGEKEGSFRVIICSQQAESMMRQLEQMGIKEYRVVY